MPGGIVAGFAQVGFAKQSDKSLRICQDRWARIFLTGNVSLFQKQFTP